MANFIEKKDRNVIPNWRSFVNTANLGELNSSENLKLDSSFKPDISDLELDWKKSNNLGTAGDIIGVALICNQEENKTVQEAAKYVLKKKQQNVTSALIEAAITILRPKQTKIEINSDLSTLEDFGEKESLKNIFIFVHQIKKKLIKNPKNAILWVELARYYSILGQDIHANKAMNNAVYLAPENRFVLRSASRFYCHFGDLERSHDILRKAELTRFDPWLIASEVALSTLRGRGSRFAKIGLNIIGQKSFHPFNISELSSSLATLELQNGNFKNSKKLFSNSLIQPNDNALAQAEWVSQEEDILLFHDLESFNLDNSYEALALEYFEKGLWDKAIEYSKKWFIDLPFSKGPLLFANNIASRKLKNHDLAFKFVKLGLVSHPRDSQLLNNIIYSLCVQNKLDEAGQYLEKVNSSDFNKNNSNGICLTATKGLFYFRLGDPINGRKFYYDALSRSKSINNKKLNSLALINYVREELIFNQIDISFLIPKLEKIIRYYQSEDLAEEAREILELYNKKKKSKYSAQLINPKIELLWK